MLPEAEILLQLLREEHDQARHTEDQRASLTNFVITISGGLLALIAALKFRTPALLPSLFVMVLGLYGAVASAKLYERFELHRDRGREFRRRIAALIPEAEIEQLRGRAATRHKGEHRVLYRVRLFWFWELFHLLIAGLGAIAALVILTR
jgi:hypothetical protein